MADIQELYCCCGVGVIGGIEGLTPHEIFLEAFVDHSGDLDYGLFVFTEHSTYTYGQAFARYIKKHKLGRVVSTRNFKNPCHTEHRGDRMLMWFPDHDKLGAYINKLEGAEENDSRRRNRSRYY